MVARFRSSKLVGSSYARLGHGGWFACGQPSRIPRSRLAGRRSDSNFHGSQTVEEVQLTDGSRIAADLVVVGVGATPNTERLNDSGLTIDDGVV